MAHSPLIIPDIFIDPGLQYPYANKTKPNHKKLANKITEGNRPLQFNRFDGFGNKVDAIKNTKHRKHVQQENKREQKEHRITWKTVIADHPGNKQANKANEEQNINKRDHKEYLKLGHFHFNTLWNQFLQPYGYRPLPAKDSSNKYQH